MTEVNTEQAKQLKSGIDITGKIAELKDIRTVNLKTGGTAKVRDAVLEDAAGRIGLTLWDTDAESVKVGSTVILHNAFSNVFKGNVSLAKGKFGKLEVV